MTYVHSHFIRTISHVLIKIKEIYIMSRVCVICGKRPASGRTIARRGLAKIKGGVGLKITGITKRKFLPNLQTVKANLNGTIKRIKVCTACIKAGKVNKA